MKIQCNVCEKAEASVLCCADEAALCWSCDEKVHAANKLASKHQRVPLSNSASQIPKCDVCQEAAGFFFCLEDRALLCRKCDVAIHSANSYVSAHQRFLLTGVKVGLEPNELGPSSSSVNSQYGGKISETKPSSISKGGQKMPISKESNESLPVRIDGVGDHASSKMPVPFSGGSVAGNTSQWNMDVEEFLGYNDFNHAYGYMDNGSSQADSGKLGGSDCSSMQRGSDGAGYECLGQVIENSWTVPQMPSPPTASGLYWPNTSRHLSEIYVPDICCSHDNAVTSQHNNRSHNLKRRRHT